MKITIVLKLMKIVVQSHNPKTNICLNYDNSQQEVQKTFLSPNIVVQVQRSKGAKNRDLHTLSSTLQLSSHFICRYVTYIYITSFFGDMQILSATLHCLTKGGCQIANFGKKSLQIHLIIIRE